jgi:hypothetical protein
MRTVRGRTVRRAAAGLAVVLCASGPLAGAPARIGAVPLVLTVRHARECAGVQPASATRIVIPVVVDLGGPSDSAEVTCVSVPPGSDGAQVLVARAKILGVPAPRYNETGLLCAIDGYPTTGCGLESGSHYAYWAYFHGGSSWTYADVGPAEWQVFAGDVEGWRFEPDGSASPTDPPPRAPSDASTLCPSSSGPPTTTTSTPSTTSPPTTVPTSPGSSHTDGGPGPAAVPPVSSGPTPSRATSDGPPSTAPGGPISGPSRDAVTPSTTIGSTAPAGNFSARATHLAVGRTPPAHRGAPVGVIVGVALIVLLTVGALIRGRRSARVR